MLQSPAALVVHVCVVIGSAPLLPRGPVSGALFVYSVNVAPWRLSSIPVLWIVTVPGTTGSEIGPTVMSAPTPAPLPSGTVAATGAATVYPGGADVSTTQ